MRNAIFYFLFLTISFNNFSQQILKREVRGVWIASVVNIDFPSSNNLSVQEQQIELIKILDALQESKINTIFFQVRTECDALYNSFIEPWSFHLTGKQGKSPEPFYDPLEFAINESHKRGMELHAWLNPYRAERIIGSYETASSHITKRHPEWLLKFNGYKMLNPGIPEVRNYILSVVDDIISRYDVDGIHFDDYFYPYEPLISNEDESTFKQYSRGFTNIDDWRRDNINELMRMIYRRINEINPRIKFGVSPFGIVENKYTGTSGMNSYSTIYCDPISWLKEKVVDYVIPQIYWERGNNRAAFEKILPWWTTITNERHLFIGLYATKLLMPDWKGEKDELFRQIEMTRNYDNIQGAVFFSAKAIVNNYSNAADSLQEVYYPRLAFPYTMKWKDSIPPNAPMNIKGYKSNDMYKIEWQLPEKASDGEIVSRFAVYRIPLNLKPTINDSQFLYKIFQGDITSFFISEDDANQYRYVVTSLDRLWNESKAGVSIAFKK